MKRKCQNGAGKVNIGLELITNEVGGTKTANDRKCVYERVFNPTTRRTLLFLLHSPTTTRSFPSIHGVLIPRGWASECRRSTHLRWKDDGRRRGLSRRTSSRLVTTPKSCSSSFVDLISHDRSFHGQTPIWCDGVGRRCTTQRDKDM